MAGQFAVPFHFAVEFLVLVVAIGAALESLRARRHGAGVWTLGQAGGFFSLAAAQVIHGALISAADAAPYVLGLRTVAFALLALTARPAAGILASPLPPIAVAGSFPALFLPGVNADLAVLPAVAALVVGVRGARAHRVDQHPATFAFAAAFVALALAEGATAVAPADGGAWLMAAHSLRAAGALLLARWLWTSIVGSVRMRFVAVYVALLALAVLLVSAALNVVIGSRLESEELERLADAGRARVTKFRDLGDTGLVTAETFADSASIQNLLDRRDPRWSGAQGRRERSAEAQKLSQQIMSIAPSSVDLVMLVDRGGRVIGSAAATERRIQPIPSVEVIPLAGSEVVREALDGRPSASPITTSRLGSEAGDVTSQLVVLSASPSRRGGSIVGTVVVGFRIDERFLTEVQQDVSAEATLLVGREVGGTTFEDAPAIISVIDRLGGALDEPRISGETFQRRLTIGGQQFSTVFVPVPAADDQVIGLMALSQRTDALEGAQRDTTRTLFLIAMLAMILAALLAYVSGGRVTRPIRSLTDAARELRSGNYAARTQVRSHDEVGTLGGAFNEMAEELQRKAGELRSAARSEASLRAHMEAIVQSMGDALVATDADGTIVMFNRAAEQMMKRRADAAIGCSIGDVIQGTTDGGRRLAEAAMTARAVEGTLVRSGGSQIPIAMTAGPLVEASGTSVGRVVVVRDVTREHEAERMKSEFLSNVSHELRTPITPIKGYAEILKRKRFPREKTEQFLNGVLESTERLERIVEILVDFASMEAGRLKPRADAVPVNRLLGSVSARWEARSSDHRFVRKNARGVPSVRGDERLLERCLNELVDNAVKFSPEGGTIELSAGAEVNGARRRKASKVKITVRDTGIGIEPERLPELFMDFRQLDGSETRSYGGLGLGLAYVKRIANVHGGDVTVESTPGRGTAFSLVLPAADTPKAMPVPERLVPGKRAAPKAAAPKRATPRTKSTRASSSTRKTADRTRKRAR